MAETTAVTTAAPAIPRSHTESRFAWVKLLIANRVGAVSSAFVILLVLMAIFADQIVPHSPFQIYGVMRLAPAGTIAPDGRPFLLGGDEIGRDLFARVIYGSRISLTVGILAVGIGLVLGSALGLVSGYFAGKLDLVIQRFTDAQQAIPGLLLAMLLISVLEPSIWVVVLAVGIGQIPRTNRIVRGATLSARSHQYIESARTIGASTPRILLKHILPNVTAPIIIIATTSLGGAIVVEASLSFLGVGVPPPDPAWGSMISAAGRQFMFRNPMLLIAPASILALTVLSFNMAGDALRDIWDPRLRGR